MSSHVRWPDYAVPVADVCVRTANVDWALLNFMKDWFPLEAKKKLQQNEREAAEEEMQELGLDVRGCVVM